MGRTMNPSNWEPPHLLVVEWVDWSDTGDDGIEAHLECPYQIHEYTTYTDVQESALWADAVGGEYSMYREYGHDRTNYCTAVQSNWNRKLRPKVVLRSSWRDPDMHLDMRCARIEINATAGPVGVCIYQECVNNVGLVEALTGWRSWDSWRKGEVAKPDPVLPDEPGVYPVYYWSEGYGEGFEDGLTLERQPVEDLWRDDAAARMYHVSSSPV